MPPLEESMDEGRIIVQSERAVKLCITSLLANAGYNPVCTGTKKAGDFGGCARAKNRPLFSSLYSRCPSS